MPLKLSMMSCAILWGEGLTEADVVALCELTHRLNLDAIDWVTTYGVPAQLVRTICDDFGLQTCCHTFWADLNYPTTAGRTAGLDAVKRGVEAAVALGADKIMIPPAGRDEVTREQARRNYIGGLAEALPIAQEAGVTLTIEDFAVGNSPFVTSSEMLEAVHETPGLLLTFDSGNPLTGGEDPLRALEAVKAHTVHVHFKDWYIGSPLEGFRGLDGRWFGSAIIGQGIVDNAGCLWALKEAGYGGYINVEAGASGCTPTQAVEASVKYLREVMTRLSIEQ